LRGDNAKAYRSIMARFAASIAMDPRGEIAKSSAVDPTDWTDLLLTCRKWFAAAVACVEAKQPLPPVMSELSQNQSQDELQIKLALDAFVRREFPSTATWDPADLRMAADIAIVGMHSFLHRTHMDQEWIVDWVSGAYGAPTRMMDWCLQPTTASARACTMAIEAAADGYSHRQQLQVWQLPSPTRGGRAHRASLSTPNRTQQNSAAGVHSVSVACEWGTSGESESSQTLPEQRL
jgi:hypothetical protein